MMQVIAAGIHLDADPRRRQMKWLAQQRRQLPVFISAAAIEGFEKRSVEYIRIGGKSIGGEHRCDHAITCTMAGVKRFGHGTAVQADAARLRRGDTERELHSSRFEVQ